MDNPEKLATLGTQNTGRTQTKQKTQHSELKMSNTDPTKHRGEGVNPCAREGYAVPVAYKTLVVLCIYTVKSGKSLGSDRGKKTIYIKIHCYLRYGYFETVNKIVMMTV